MFYAVLQQSDETLKLRFYSRSERDAYCAERGAQPTRSRSIKFVPGADRNVTLVMDEAGAFRRL